MKESTNRVAKGTTKKATIRAPKVAAKRAARVADVNATMVATLEAIKGITNREKKIQRIVGDKEATISSKMIALNLLQVPATMVCQMLGNKRPQHFRNVVEPFCRKNGIPYNTYNKGGMRASISEQLDAWFVAK